MNRESPSVVNLGVPREVSQQDKTSTADQATIELSDEQWQSFQLLLLGFELNRAGRPRNHSYRRIITGLRYREVTGCCWRDIPPQYGNWQNIHMHFIRWRKSGFIQLLNVQYEMALLLESFQTYLDLQKIRRRLEDQFQRRPRSAPRERASSEAPEPEEPLAQTTNDFTASLGGLSAR